MSAPAPPPIDIVSVMIALAGLIFGHDLALVANANDPDVIPLVWWSGCRRIIRRLTIKVCIAYGC